MLLFCLCCLEMSWHTCAASSQLAICCGWSCTVRPPAWTCHRSQDLSQVTGPVTAGCLDQRLTCGRSTSIAHAVEATLPRTCRGRVVVMFSLTQLCFAL